MRCIFVLILCFAIIKYSQCSIGDNSQIFQNCLSLCMRDCSDYTNRQSLALYITRWSCKDNCKYECMWKTVDSFHERNKDTPQFYGKWPFIRFFGIQEPASVAFSILNGYVHWKMMKRFRREALPCSPLDQFIWNAFYIVSIHAWFWSAVFHARDCPFTEILDYACAFSINLMFFYVMIIRFLRYLVSESILTALFFSFIISFIFYVFLLYSRGINYGFNMQVNIMLGGVSAMCWIIWCINNYKRQLYVWKCAAFVLLTVLVTVLEVIDVPPLLYIFDTHSLWHLATAPLAILFYSFGIDDCNYLKEDFSKKLRYKKNL